MKEGEYWPLPPHPLFPSVDKRTSSLRKNLVRVHLSQTDDNCEEAKSQRTEKMLQRMAILRLNLYIRRRRY